LGGARWPCRGLGSLGDLAQEGVGGEQRCSVIARQDEPALVTPLSQVSEVRGFLFRRSEFSGERLSGGQGTPLCRRERLRH
jgi:hypothetical protein